MACDPATLLAQAQCITTCIPNGMMAAVNTSLLCQIATNGVAAGGGGSGSVQVYIGRAPAAPDNPALAALSYPAGGGSLQQWDVGSATWV